MATRITVSLSLSLSLALLAGAAVVAEDTPEKKPAETEKAKAVKVVKKIQAKAVAAVVNIKVVAGKVTAKALEEQKVAAKKVADATKAVAAAEETLAKASAEAAAAKTPDEKDTTAKNVAEAKAKLDVAKKQLEEGRNEVKKAAVKVRAAIQVRTFVYGNVAGVRKEVDRGDSKERFVMLTPGGPVVVEVSITLDGKPFRVARETLIDELLVAADTNKDGKATWEEAFKSPIFTMGRIRITNDQQKKQLLNGFDKNKDGLVDRMEVRQFVAQYFQGPAFTLTARNNSFGSFRGGLVIVNGQRMYRGGGRADVQKFLDTDDDGVLSQDEIAKAGDRLKSKDADDNDLLYPGELNGKPVAAGNRAAVRISTSRQVQTQVALLLGPTAKADTVFAAIQQRYKNKEGKVVAASFPALPKLFETLDKNKNGALEQTEVMALNSIAPQIVMTADLGKSDGPKGLSLKSVAPELTKSAQTGAAAGVELPGVKLAFRANLTAAPTYNYSSTAKSYLMRYDKDNNGYLELKELPKNFGPQLKMWDIDSDGKVYPKEIVAFYNRQRAPYQTQVRANATSDGNSLFQALDASGDSRLSLREMRTAHERIKEFDKNKDGKITKDEIPVTLSVSFGRGNTSYNSYRAGQGKNGNANRGANKDVPAWFTRTDRNGDGDITLREFLGTKEEFDKLDSNQDGFIEPKEAIAASKGNTAKTEKPDAAKSESGK